MTQTGAGGLDELHRAGGCTDGNCPQIAVQGSTYLVRGYRTDRTAIPEMDVPDGEAVVSIPRDVMHALLAQLRA